MPPPTNQILFDEDARREFLTGFHKRKQAKIEAAKQRAKEREKQDRLLTRRQQRETLRERARENAALVEQAYGAEVDEDGDEWSGIQIPTAKPKEDEYEGEETLATVTVVEDFDPESAIYGSKPPQPPMQQERPSGHIPDARPTHKPKARKISYETKAARKAERQKQRARKTEKAELAGGKAARKKSNPRGKKGMRR